jgi:hypothetical protein
VTPSIVYSSNPVVYGQSTVVYTSPPPVVAPRPAPTVDYPHGRFELRGDGVRTAYHWVWVPKVPPPPPPPPAPDPPPTR